MKKVLARAIVWILSYWSERKLRWYANFLFGFAAIWLIVGVLVYSVGLFEVPYASTFLMVYCAVSLLTCTFMYHFMEDCREGPHDNMPVARSSMWLGTGGWYSRSGYFDIVIGVLNVALTAVILVSIPAFAIMLLFCEWIPGLVGVLLRWAKRVA